MPSGGANSRPTLSANPIDCVDSQRVDVYSPQRNVWETLSPTLAAHREGAATAHSEQIYAIGGHIEVVESTRVTSIPSLDCSNATASVTFPRLGNRHRYPVTIQGVTAPSGGSVDLTITSLSQDEPVTNPTGKTCPDGIGVGTAVAKVRNERLLAGDGRVYHIGFTATDEAGDSCTGEVQVCAPRNEGEECGDQGALFDSTVCP